MQFRTIHEVPKGLRKINGSALGLDQVNKLIAEVLAEAKPDGSDFSACLGRAQQRFVDSHAAVNGQWADRAEG